MLYTHLNYRYQSIYCDFLIVIIITNYIYRNRTITKPLLWIIVTYSQISKCFQQSQQRRNCYKLNLLTNVVKAKINNYSLSLFTYLSTKYLLIISLSEPHLRQQYIPAFSSPIFYTGVQSSIPTFAISNILSMTGCGSPPSFGKTSVIIFLLLIKLKTSFTISNKGIRNVQEVFMQFQENITKQYKLQLIHKFLNYFSFYMINF